MNRILTEDFENLIKQDLPFENLRGKKILVTGAAGFVPSYFVKFLLYLNQWRDLQIELTGLVRNPTKARAVYGEGNFQNAFKLLIQDVSEPLQTEESFDFIVHAASPASPKYYGSDPVGVIRPNALGTFQLLEHARRTGLQKFVFISTAEIYGSLEQDQVEEEDLGRLDPFQLRSCYAESKRLGETLCRSYQHQYRIPVNVVRPFHTYGPGMDFQDGRVFCDFVGHIVQNKNLTLNSDGSARRAFCYLSDAVSGILHILLKAPEGEAYNLGNPGGELSVLELAELLVGLFPEKNLKLEKKARVQEGYIKSAVSRIIPSVQKLNSLGWKPVVSPKEGFRRTVLSYEEGGI